MPVSHFRSKTIVFCIGVLFLVAAGGIWGSKAVRAQDRTIALRAGLSGSTLSGEGDFDPLVNLTGALLLRMGMGAIFLQTEAQVATRGTSNPQREPFPTIPGTTNNYSRLRTDITYVDVPVLIGTKLGSGLQPMIYAGPYGGLRVDARNQFTNAATDLTTTREARDVKLIDYGVAAGLGMEFPTRFYDVIVDLRGSLGLAPVYDTRGNERHRMLTLTAGFV